MHCHLLRLLRIMFHYDFQIIKSQFLQIRRQYPSCLQSNWNACLGCLALELLLRHSWLWLYRRRRRLRPTLMRSNKSSLFGESVVNSNLRWPRMTRLTGGARQLLMSGCHGDGVNLQCNDLISISNTLGLKLGKLNG